MPNHTSYSFPTSLIHDIVAHIKTNSGHTILCCDNPPIEIGFSCADCKRSWVISVSTLRAHLEDLENRQLTHDLLRMLLSNARGRMLFAAILTNHGGPVPPEPEEVLGPSRFDRLDKDPTKPLGALNEK